MKWKPEREQRSVGWSVGTRVATDASRAGAQSRWEKAEEHTPLGLHHSTPSLQTCVLLPNNLIPPSITHSRFQRVILGAAWERARCYGNHSSSWMEPRVVKVKRRRRPLRAAGLFPVPSPRFNGGFTWSGGGGDGCLSQHLNSVMSRLFQRGWTHQSTPHTCRAVAQLTVSFLKQSKRTYTQLLKEKGENTSWVGEEEYVREPWGERTGWGGSVKGGQRQQQQTERKQEEAAKSVDVVLSSSFCRLVLFLHSKIHYYITPSMGNFPELTRSLWARLAYLFYCWLQRY